MKKSKWIAAGAIASGIAYMAALKYYYDFCFKRNEKQDEPYQEGSKLEQINRDGMKWIKDHGYDEVTIDSRDGLKLTGYYFDLKSDQTIILVHGYRCNGFKEYAAYVDFLSTNHYNLLIVDQRSHGKSEGKWIGFGYEERYDLLEWSKWLQENKPCRNLYYYGISMGSATAMLASNEQLEQYSVRAIVADCGYDRLDHEVKAVMKSMKVPPFLFYQPSNQIHRIQFGHGIEDINPIESIKNAKVPVLFIHGTEDHFVPTNMVFKLYEACSSEKELLLIENAPHAGSHYTKKEQYETRVLSFLQKYSK